MADRIDMRAALAVLDEVREAILALDGVEVNVEKANRTRNQAAINKQLLYTAHLCDVTRLAVMSEYHRFKGEDPPVIVTD